jgi:acetyl esterase/lipase
MMLLLLAQNAPVIVMVHGGGWRIGDKSMRRMVRNKVDYWCRAASLHIH